MNEAAPKGQIHDLGYKRYAGTRRSHDTRWTVILRHQLAMSWQTRWRTKVWLILALVLTGVGAGMIYLMSGRTFRMFTGAAGANVNFADGTVAVLMPQFCKLGFFVGLLGGATLIAGDLQSGAFTFYFARSVRPRDYVLGKWVAMLLVLAAIVLVGPVLLAVMRVALAGTDTDQLLATLPLVGKTFAVAALATLTYATLPLGFSALIGNRRYAMALWAAYYVVIGTMFAVLGLFVHPVLGVLDPGVAIETVMLRLLDFDLTGGHVQHAPLWAALLSIAVQCGAALAIMIWRVRNAQQTGVVGAS